MSDNAVIGLIYNAYLECALWSSYDSDAEEYLDVLGYSAADIAEDTIAVMSSDCELFFLANRGTIGNLCMSGRANYAQIGHDLWLTRNGHGAGFWDRGLGSIGHALTFSAKNMGEYNLYVGDDNLVHGFVG